MIELILSSGGRTGTLTAERQPLTQPVDPLSYQYLEPTCGNRQRDPR